MSTKAENEGSNGVSAPGDVQPEAATMTAAARNRLVNELVFVQGIGVTKETLREWNRRPWPVMRSWLALSVAIAVVLLGAVYVVARLSIPDPSRVYVPGYNTRVTPEAVGYILFRNSLVLALHAFACVAGFIAGNSLPLSAAKRSGFSRTIHEKAGPLAIGFVAFATLFSLSTQAYFLGSLLASLAAQLGLSDLRLLLLLTPHALLELTALFLPLAAWLVASRKDDWDQLLAATFVTVAIAVPTLIVSAIIEVTVFPDLIRAATGTG
jgi:hypothetical protein